jgi:hypothetical protein
MQDIKHAQTRLKFMPPIAGVMGIDGKGKDDVEQSRVRKGSFHEWQSK